MTKDLYNNLTDHDQQELIQTQETEEDRDIESDYQNFSVQKMKRGYYKFLQTKENTEDISISVV